MATTDLTKVLRVSAQLSINPTSLAGSFPWGGTSLGLVQDIVVRPSRAFQPIHEEAFGVEVVDVLDLGESWIVTAALRSFDPDAVAAVFPSVINGVTSGKKSVAYPNPSGSGQQADGTFRAGTLRSAAAVKLLVTPKDTRFYPAIYFPNALPLVDEAAEVNLNLSEEGLIPVVFHATRDSQNRVAVVARLEDIVL